MEQHDDMSTMAGSSRFDRARAEAFSGEMLATLNHGGLCLMLSVGHRTGLFDVMSGMLPATPEEIAAKAGLGERYVLEWLGAMVTASVVEVDSATRRYTLPAEHAASLARAAGAGNLAIHAQYIPLLGSVEDDIVGCFRKGGGVSYSRYGRFHQVMAEESGESVLPWLESRIIPLVPGLHERLGRGIRVLDIGCGRGRIINRLAALYPTSRFVGMDLDREAIECAGQEAVGAGHANVEFLAVDLSDFDRTAEARTFDLVTAFDAIHDQGRPLNVLKGVHRALKPDGVYLMQDIRGSSHHHRDADLPLGTFSYATSCMHCLTVSLAQGGEGLGAMWGEEKAREYLRMAGFGSVTVHQLAHDIQNSWYVTRM